MEKNTQKKTRTELRYDWLIRNDKCHACVNAGDCKAYQNGVQACNDYVPLPIEEI